MDNIKKFEDFLSKMQGLLGEAKKQGHIIIRVEDLENAFPEIMESDDKNKPNGGIVMEDFKEGNGSYKVNLAYLNEEQVKEIEELVKKWNPELKESEDERIRKALIKAISRTHKGNKLFGTDVTREEALAWLEKQGEQKASYTGDIEIPFGAKDSELQEVSYHIPEGFHAEIEGDKVTIKQGDQKSLTIDIKSMVDSYEQRLIKNGGVSNSPLVNMCVAAFKHGVENTLDELHLKQIPANSCKICKDEWDVEKKELKKISQRMVSAEAKEALYDKPAWSEEEEVKINRIVACLENLNVADNDILLKDVD